MTHRSLTLRLLAALLLGTACGVAVARADTVTLRNGNRIHGHLVHATRTVLVLEIVGQNGTITIPRSQVERFQRDSRDGREYPAPLPPDQADVGWRPPRPSPAASQPTPEGGLPAGYRRASAPAPEGEAKARRHGAWQEGGVQFRYYLGGFYPSGIRVFSSPRPERRRATERRADGVPGIYPPTAPIFRLGAERSRERRAPGEAERRSAAPRTRQREPGQGSPQPGQREPRRVTPQPGQRQRGEHTPQPGQRQPGEYTPQPGQRQPGEYTPQPGQRQPGEYTPQPGQRQPGEYTPQPGQRQPGW